MFYKKAKWKFEVACILSRECYVFTQRTYKVHRQCCIFSFHPKYKLISIFPIRVMVTRKPLGPLLKARPTHWLSRQLVQLYIPVRDLIQDYPGSPNFQGSIRKTYGEVEVREDNHKRTVVVEGPIHLFAATFCRDPFLSGMLPYIRRDSPA